jgi:two-component sensor histidine kinase
MSAIEFLTIEIITNTIKHAFKEKETGVIGVFFSVAENQGTLIILENGPGIPG